MPEKSPFSSTMRIDLTADTDDGAQRPAVIIRPAKRAPPLRTEHAETSECEIVGSDDFRELLQSVYDAAIITGIDGKVITSNRRAEQFFLYDVSRVADLHITDLLSGSDASLMETICESLESNRFILIQAYCLRADRSEFPAEVSVNMLQLSGQAYISFFIRDVTFRMEAEERLRTGHAAIQNSGNGIAVTDSDANLQYCNPAMCMLLDIDPEADPPTRITAFLIDPKLGTTIAASVAAGDTWSGEIEMARAAGTPLIVQASVAPNVDADSAVVGMVWSLIDISGQKRIQRALLEHNAQLAEDLSLANEFQLAFIQGDYPTFPPGVENDESVIDLGHAYIPSGAVGGDFFEIFAVSMSRVGIFISDVMGHGVRSALIVATIRGLIEELGPFRYDPAAFLSHMNRDLSRIINHPGHAMFATAFYMVLDLADGTLTCAGAGHPAPFLLQSANGQAVPLYPEICSGDPALGLFPTATYRSETFPIAPGDAIILYTDGIYEAGDPDGEAFGSARMAASLSRHTGEAVSAMLERLIRDVRTFCGGDSFDDDVCLVGLKLRRLLNANEAE